MRRCVGNYRSVNSLLRCLTWPTDLAQIPVIDAGYGTDRLILRHLTGLAGGGLRNQMRRVAARKRSDWSRGKGDSSDGEPCVSDVLCEGAANVDPDENSGGELPGVPRRVGSRPRKPGAGRVSGIPSGIRGGASICGSRWNGWLDSADCRSRHHVWNVCRFGSVGVLGAGNASSKFFPRFSTYSRVTARRYYSPSGAPL